ncbi:phosphate/phosphite/phosphonate ABC transporter substrate-binding protein [Herbaspirillum sp. RTI4]|uniref:phosphate/phosphite/phosphonate ABC transporter substrate-binding protein n=1 Tax=Herbaspirillum sp. RTI4 TaxID=3048640 RepID=UPI002AB37867|nr:phosphate/phosphite/phosphonate ABC transporter substrate-binding protein [Herbaspirillum sp. RTI4]MDY7577650.1 phosphate/phosphite/phosphonate ABC transporter substrate-binding protein [Herbaspirillum sp. RTI4]MEA9982184.1 phosphate/phosphite/phosphonate ABC transporter substrate-binding protein [Herbaspirillum sp. RTI4]
MRGFQTAVISILFAGCAFTDTAIAAPDALPVVTVGIVPQQSPDVLAKAWEPILHFLSEKSGMPLRFATAKDISTFEQRLEKGEYDIAYMNPYHYTVFHRSPGYLVFAKEKDLKLKGIVVVRKDGNYSDIKQLQGKTLAFPGPTSFAATMLPQAEFRTRGISVESRYVSSHDSVYLGVVRGLFDAGGGVVKTFDNIRPELRDQLKILWSTKEYTPHAFAAHPRMPKETVRRLQEAMMTMEADPEGARLLQTIGFKGISAAQDKEYDAVRHLNIQPQAATR